MVDKINLEIQKFSKSNAGVPSIQTTTPSVRSTPSLRTFAGDSITNAFAATADDAVRLQAIKQSDIATASGVFDNAITEIRTRQTIEAEKTYSEASMTIQAQITKARENTANYEAIPEVTENIYDSVTSTVLEQEGLSQFQRDQLQQKFDRQKVVIAEDTMRYQQQVKALETEVALEEIARNDSNTVFNSPNLLRARIAEAGETLRSIGVPEVEIAKQLQTYKENMTKSAILGHINKSPLAAARLVESGEFDDLISGNEKFQLSEMARSRVAKEKTKTSLETIQQTAEFKVAMKSDPFSYTDSDIKERIETLGLSDSEAEKIFISHAEAKLEQGEKLKRKNRVITAAQDNSGVFLNPDNKDDVKDVDLVYKEDIMPVVENMRASGQNFSSVNDRLVNFIDSTNIIPSQVRTEISGKIKAGSTEARMEVIDLAEKVKKRNPQISLGLSAADQAFLDRSSEVLSYNPNNPEEAMRTVENELSLDEGLRSMRTSTFTKEFDFEKSGKKLRKALDDQFFADPDFDVDPNSLQTAQLDMEKATREYYLSNPDMDKAMDYGISKMKELYSAENIDGNQRLMKFAPSKYVDPVDGSHDFLAIQLAQDVASVNPDLKPGEYYLAPDFQTQRSVRSNTMPSYQIMIVNEDGSTDQLRKDGVAQRYIPKNLSQEEIEQQRTEEFIALKKKLKEGGEKANKLWSGHIGGGI